MAQDIEYFDVLYTKHIKQKSKSWEDGFLEYHLKSSKVRRALVLISPSL
jgi:hypothetical protein